jgi:hypothetical protein
VIVPAGHAPLKMPSEIKGVVIDLMAPEYPPLAEGMPDGLEPLDDPGQRLV